MAESQHVEPGRHRLRLFGGASIEGPDGPVIGRAAQRRRLALLALLSVARRRGMSRDKLVAVLWPDSNPERARPLLSDSVYRINQAIGGDAILATGDELRLNPERLDSDAYAFGDAMEHGEWERAVELHSAPFLDGFFLPGADEFERWADAERERHARERARALETLARDAGTQPLRAVAWWRLLAADDRYSSRVALELMRALERAGDRAAAVQHARIHTLLVREEIGVEPDAEVLRYAEQLRGTVPTVGRTDHNQQAGAIVSPTQQDAGAARAAGPVASEAAPASRSEAPVVGNARRMSLGRVVAGAALALAMAAGVAVVSPLLRPTESEGSAPTAIAVLPFVDLSPSRDQEYFADGITEELIVNLSRVEGLNVVGRSSVFAFKGTATDVREIASRLNVSAVVEGSVRKAENRLRIIGRLVDATNGYEIWSETYERELEDVFAIQEEISRAIVTRLRGRLAGIRVVPGVASSTDDSEAYNLYLQGRFEWHKRSEQGLRNAAEFFRRAVARAPDYARAHAGLGDAYAVLGFYDYLPPREAFPLAKEAARAALRFDPSLAASHATVAYVALYHEWDWHRAEEEFLRSIELDPAYSTGHQWYANFLTAMGRFDEAVREMRAAQELDPLSLIANAALGWVLYYAGDYDRAVQQFSHTLELNPQFELAYLWRGLAREELGRVDQARSDLEEAVRLSGGSGISTALLARAYAGAGDRERARAMIAQLEARGDYVPSFEIAKVHEALRDDGAALRWLRRAFEERSHSMAFLLVDPQLRRLRGNTGFQQLVQDVGLDRRPPAPPR